MTIDSAINDLREMKDHGINLPELVQIFDPIANKDEPYNLVNTNTLEVENTSFRPFTGVPIAQFISVDDLIKRVSRQQLHSHLYPHQREFLDNLYRYGQLPTRMFRPGKPSRPVKDIKLDFDGSIDYVALRDMLVRTLNKNNPSVGAEDKALRDSLVGKFKELHPEFYKNPMPTTDYSEIEKRAKRLSDSDAEKISSRIAKSVADYFGIDPSSIEVTHVPVMLNTQSKPAETSTATTREQALISAIENTNNSVMQIIHILDRLTDAMHKVVQDIRLDSTRQDEILAHLDEVVSKINRDRCAPSASGISASDLRRSMKLNRTSRYVASSGVKVKCENNAFTLVDSNGNSHSCRHNEYGEFYNPITGLDDQLVAAMPSYNFRLPMYEDIYGNRFLVPKLRPRDSINYVVETNAVDPATGRSGTFIGYASALVNTSSVVVPAKASAAAPATESGDDSED